MSYIKAENVLPQELIETIQQYVDGKLIYIPCKEKQEWGTTTSAKIFFVNVTKGYMKTIRAVWDCVNLPGDFHYRRKAFRGFSGIRDLP